jgi:CheY-like chemotaxis protein
MHLIVRHLGHDIRVVDSGFEVLAALGTGRAEYDLVFLDVQMPGLDGLATAHEICSRFPDPQRRPRLIAVSAEPLNEPPAFIDAVLAKPLTPQSLSLCIAGLLGSKPELSAQAVNVCANADEPQVDLPWIDPDHLGPVLGESENAAHVEVFRLLHEALKADFMSLRPRLARAWTEKDDRAAAELIHGLKGGVLTLGWTRFGAFCDEVLRLLRAGQFSAWDTGLAELERLFSRSSAEMERYFHPRNFTGPGTVSSRPPQL